jgi:methionyl-tRNA formyltransferase
MCTPVSRHFLPCISIARYVVQRFFQDKYIMKIIFAGTPQFAASALAALHKEHQVVAVLTQPDRPAGRGLKLAFSAVKQLALQYGLPILQPPSLKDSDVQREIAELAADVMVVAAYGLILPKEVLELPRHGCLNIHASLLPRWRGAAPIQRAIQAGDTETGVTIMQMDEGLDTGDMLLKNGCQIAETDTAQTLQDKLAEIGANSILEALSLLQKQRLMPVRQDNSKACYAPKLLKSEALIDWNQDARLIERTVRAFNPFPVCRTNLKGMTIKIWHSALSADQHGEPGKVITADKLGITVGCKSAALRLEVLQRPGGKPQRAEQFMQAIPVKVGDSFSAK